MNPHDDLIGYLQSVADFMERDGQLRSIERMVLDHGVDGEWSPRPDDVEPGTAKECFANAFATASERNWTYVEGYVVSPNLSIPILHAWCLDDDGRVVEVTLRQPGDTDCAFCCGIGSVAVETGDPEDEWYEDVECQFCDGRGAATDQPTSLEGTVYRGVPFTAKVAAEAIISSGLYGVLTSRLVLDGDLES